MAVGLTSWLQVDGVSPDAALLGHTSWLQIDGTPVVSAPAQPSDVTGARTGGATATLSLTDNSGGTAAHYLQIRVVGSPTWLDAVGATNPMPAGVTSFNATGLTPGAQYEMQAQAQRAGLNSAFVAGVAPWWQDVVVGGGGEIPGSVAAAVTVAAAGVVTGAVSIAATVASAAVSAVVAAAGSITGVASATATVGAAAAAVSVAAVGQVLGTAAATALVETIVIPPAPEPVSTALLRRWPDKDPRETTTISFTFPGAVSDVLMDVDAYSLYGVNDAAPSSIFDGDFVVAGNVVTRAVGEGGVDLVDYYVDCVATVAGQRLVSALVLPVRQK